MKRDGSKVVARKVTRFFIGGKGYNSEVSAYMQIAKSYVRALEYAACRKANPADWVTFEKAWYAARYPARPSCNCSFCCGKRIPGLRTPSGRGCWISKLADYRAIAREIMSGVRLEDGTPVRELKALPAAVPR